MVKNTLLNKVKSKQASTQVTIKIHRMIKKVKAEKEKELKKEKEKKK